MSNSLISVIIPTYNREELIDRCVRSVLSQTYRNIEVIVIDDHSTDGTITKVEKLIDEDDRVKLVKLEKNSGACIARNKGIEQSAGQYIAFLDSDDIFDREKIRKQLERIEETGADFCASEYTYWDKNGKKIVQSIPHGDQSECFKQLLYCNFITTGTLFGKKECLSKLNFDISLPRYQDWDLVIRLFKQYKFCFIHEPLLIQYYQPRSITASTSHEKSLDSLSKILSKNIEDYTENSLAYSQINWLIGIHSMFCRISPEWKRLWIGATHNDIKIRRLAIIAMYTLGLKSVINKFI